MYSSPIQNIFQVHENVICRYCTSKTRLVEADHRQVAQTSAKLTPGQSNHGKTQNATAPELGPVGLWSLLSSTFSGSDSIIIEETF